MTLRTLSSFKFALVALLPLGASLAQEIPIVDDPLLEEELVRHRVWPYPVGRPFPEEPLTCRHFENAIAHHTVNDSDGNPKILLTSVPTNAFAELFPNMVHRTDSGNWVRTPVPRTADGWTHVHVSRDLQHVVLFMDHQIQSADWETRVVVSGDGGNSWRYGESLRKYVYSHSIRYFRMSETGSGTAIEYNDGDVGGYDVLGYYIFETSDWGMTWSERRFEEEFDISSYVDVLAERLQRHSTKKPLREASLPGFDQCPKL